MPAATDGTTDPSPPAAPDSLSLEDREAAVAEARRLRRRRQRGDGDGIWGEDEEGGGHEDDEKGGEGRAGDGGSGNGGNGGGDGDGDGGGLSLLDGRRELGGDGYAGAYDAGPNAECPVEPFSMREEREGGGDTSTATRTCSGREEEAAGDRGRRTARRKTPGRTAWQRGGLG